MLDPCQCSISGHERRDGALLKDLPRIFSKSFLSFRRAGVSTLARYFAKMHNAFSPMNGEKLVQARALCGPFYSGGGKKTP
jgi:hypothetical protein